MMTARQGQTHQDEPVPDPAALALRQAQIAATAAAVVPTVLASQGMVALGHDVLHLPVVVALAIAVFLEIGLVASALLARASAVAGRPAGADAVAVWVLSAVSGILSSAHELLSEADALGHRSWQHDAPSVLAAGVRLVAPLVAAWLWERVLVSTRRQLAARSLAEIRRDRRLLLLGAAALRVQRLQRTPESDARSGEGRHARRIRRARRTLDRRHLALLRHSTPTDPQLHRDIQIWLSGFGVVDHYPAMTVHQPATVEIEPDIDDEPVPSRVERESDADADAEIADKDTDTDTDTDDGLDQEYEALTSEQQPGDLPLEGDVPKREPQHGAEPGDAGEPLPSPPAAPATVPARALAGPATNMAAAAPALAPASHAGGAASSMSRLTTRQMAAVEIMRATHPGAISAPALARELRALGFATSDRTALRDLAVARAHLGPTALTVVR